MILDIFDRPIAFHRSLVSVVGSITGALLLSQAIYWQRRCKSDDGWFWKTQKDWEEETGMSRREFDTARKACEGILLSDRRGVPAKLFFKIDENALQTRLAESAKLDCPKAPNRLGDTSQTTIRESTSETTSIVPPSAGDAKAAAEADRKKRHTDFIDLWTKSYEAKFKRAYVFNGGRDGRAVKDVLSATKMSASVLADLAWRAWHSKGREFWNCERAITIAYFASHLNEIVSELGFAIQPPTSGAGEDDHEARYGFQRGSVPLSKRPPPFEDEAGADIGQSEYEKRFPLNLYDHDK